MIKKNIKYTVGHGIGIENGECVEMEVLRFGHFTRESFQKKIRKDFPDITIMSVEVKTETYQMDVETFMQHGDLVKDEQE